MFNFSQLITTGNLFSLFFKAFAVVLSIIYLVYAIVVLRQTQIMLRTLIVKTGAGIILAISLIQIVVALLLLLLAFGIM